MRTIAETCVRFDAAHVSINLVSEIAVPMFPTLNDTVLHFVVCRSICMSIWFRKNWYDVPLSLYALSNHPQVFTGCLFDL